MTPHILFVDDETEVLEGLRVRLRQRRKEWKMSFAQGGRDALALMEKTPVDILVSDLRMPEMDGATLLERVRQAYPSTSRLVLSGHGEETMVMRAMACSHDFLPKPCPPGLLESTLERISALQALIQDPVLKAAVGRIGSLPSQPAVYTQLMTALSSERTTPEAVAAILLADGALCAQLLHIVNSSYFRLSRPIVKVEEAVLYLGLATVRQLALVAEVFRETGERVVHLGARVTVVQEHSLFTATIASAILSGHQRRDLAFVAALLHDVGKLIIASELPERDAMIQERVAGSHLPMVEAERQLFGTTHAELGGYLLALWQLPFQVVEAVANHHRPRAMKPRQLDVLLAVHVADYLAHEYQAKHTGEALGPWAQLDLPLLQELGLAEKLNEWRSLVGEHASRRG
jgi:putative nucleotidyltransferase with HDIG domain